MGGAVVHWMLDDGGREAAGFSVKNDAGDCVVRAIAIAMERSYADVYDEIADLSHDFGGPRSARDGVLPAVTRRYMDAAGWLWTPTMKIGSGCTVHLREDELPGGRLIVRLSRHVCAVINGCVHDTYDPSREGTRCVYGYWSQA